MLKALDFELNIPIPYRFLRRYARVNIDLSIEKNHVQQSSINTSQNMLFYVCDCKMSVIAK